MDAAKKGAGAVGVAAAAHRVGVAAATLRAWDHRYGLRPSGRTEGGHRRYSDDDVATLTRVQCLIESGMPAASAAALHQTQNIDPGAAEPIIGGLGGADRDEYARLDLAAQSLKAGDLARVMRSVLARRGVVSAWTDVFVPYLQALGRRWSTVGHGIECEHLTVAVLQSVLRKDALRRRIATSQRGVLLSAVPGESHTLPLDALAAALAEVGLTTFVVYDLPAQAVRAALARSEAEQVVVWARGSADGGGSVLRLLRGSTASIYAAGPGWRDDRLPPDVVHLRDLSTAVNALRTVT